MSKIEITAAEATRDHAEVVARLLPLLSKKIERSRAKKKGTINDVQYYYDVVLHVEPVVMSEWIMPKAPAPTQTEEDITQSCIAATHVHLVAYVGNNRVNEPIAIPERVILDIRESRAATVAEKARIAAQTPEERAAEVESLLKQLRRGKGFIAL